MALDAVTALVAALVASGCGYFLIVLAAAVGFARRRARRRPAGGGPRFSVLKPLAGSEPDLAGNLRGFFELDWPDYELLFAARDPADPALDVARALARRYPGVQASVVAVPDAHWPNAKVQSLAAMTRVATGSVLVISDSDIRARPSLLKDLAAEFRAPGVGVVTCPYRAAPGGGPWSVLEALGMNTEFWGGVLAAQFLLQMDFAVGPTMAVSRSCLDAAGGWDDLGDYLAEDFQIGRRARRSGFEVRLGTHVVEHRIGSQRFAANMAHRIRWRRSTRRSRPAGYWGELLANPLPWVPILLAATWAADWACWLAAACVALRVATAAAMGGVVLRDALVARCLWLLPVQDAFSLATWAAGCFGKRVAWRDRTYDLAPDGRMRPVTG